MRSVSASPRDALELPLCDGMCAISMRFSHIYFAIFTVLQEINGTYFIA